MSHGQKLKKYFGYYGNKKIYTTIINKINVHWTEVKLIITISDGTVSKNLM